MTSTEEDQAREMARSVVMNVIKTVKVLLGDPSGGNYSEIINELAGTFQPLFEEKGRQDE